jgi:hypothetical protein
MKLVFCTECWDVFKLARELRACECGYCVGKYLEDETHAVTNGRGICVAFNNNKLVKSIIKLRDSKCGERGIPLEAWIREHDGISNPRSSVDKNLSWKHVKRAQTTVAEEGPVEEPEKAGLTD